MSGSNFQFSTAHLCAQRDFHMQMCVQMNHVPHVLARNHLDVGSKDLCTNAPALHANENLHVAERDARVHVKPVAFQWLSHLWLSRLMTLLCTVAFLSWGLLDSGTVLCNHRLIVRPEWRLMLVQLVHPKESPSSAHQERALAINGGLLASVWHDLGWFQSL